MYQCPQNTPYAVIGMEDCLKINVYVPAISEKPLPVMVYIHGGAFVLGNGGKMVHGPEFLMKHDVILVTFNYRLGVLGFLCLGIEEAPGNAGLKDQVAALKWVKKNIAAFGGDPDNVTIFGQSAGGASAAFHVANNISPGLFERAIIQSGSSLTNWAINRDPIKIARNIAKLLGHDIKEPRQLYELFSKMHYKDLISAISHISLVNLYHEGVLSVPCIDKKYSEEEPFFTDLPYNLITKKPRNIPLMYGTTDREGLLFVSEATDEFLEPYNDKKKLLGDDLAFNSKEEEMKISKDVKHKYFGSKLINKQTLTNLSELFTDLHFEMPMLMETEIMAQRIDAPIYNYHFTYSGGRNMVKYHFGFKNEPGACHGDDIMYIFDGRVWPHSISKEDQKVIERMTKMITNFAKYGDPTPKITKTLPIRWLPSDKEQLRFMYIGEELKMGPIAKPESFQFWKSIYQKYRRI